MMNDYSFFEDSEIVLIVIVDVLWKYWVVVDLLCMCIV